MPVLAQRFEVKAPIQKTWDFLFDVEKLKSCIPGCEEMTKIDDTHYAATIKVKVGFLSAGFKGQVEIIETDPPHRLVSKATGKDAKTMSMLNMTNTLELKELGPSATEVSYNAQVNVLGNLGNFGWGIMEKKAQELGGEFARNIKSKLETEA